MYVYRFSGRALDVADGKPSASVPCTIVETE